VNGLIMATEPLLTVLMLGRLGFAPWQYGLAFAVPCAGGLIGSRLARRLAARFGQHRVMLVAGTLRACWLIGLVFLRPGAAGIVLVIAIEFGLITCCGVFNPVLATYRLEQTRTDRVARTLSAWSVSTSATIAALTILGGLLASVTGPRTAMAVAGLLILATPLPLLPHKRKQPPQASPENYPHAGRVNEVRDYERALQAQVCASASRDHLDHDVRPPCLLDQPVYLLTHHVPPANLAP